MTSAAPAPWGSKKTRGGVTSLLYTLSLSTLALSKEWFWIRLFGADIERDLLSSGFISLSVQTSLSHSGWLRGLFSEQESLSLSLGRRIVRGLFLFCCSSVSLSEIFLANGQCIHMAGARQRPNQTAVVNKINFRSQKYARCNYFDWRP